MAVSARKVQNKRDSNGALTGKPDTVYDVNIRYNSPEGKKTYSKKGFATKKEATQHEAEMKTKLVNPTFMPVVASQGKQTVKEYLEEWVENHGKANLRPSTFAGYKSHIRNHIVPYIGHVQLNQLTPAMLDNMFQQLFDKGLYWCCRFGVLFCKFNFRRLNKMVAGHLSVKHGNYYAVLNYKNAEGKRKTKWISLGLPEKGNKRKAEAELAKLRAEFEVPEEVGDLSSDMLFADYLLEWLEIAKGRLAIATYSSYLGLIKSVIEPYFRKKKLALRELEARHLQMFYSEQLKKVKPNTVIHYHAVIHSALKYAVKTDMLLQNVADKVDRPKKNDFQPVFLSAEEMQKMFEALRGTRLELPVLVAAFYGFRRGEVLGLKWDAIDFERGTISVKRTVTTVSVDGKHKEIEQQSAKTKSSLRTLPLIGSFRDYFMQVKEAQELNKKICGNCYNYEYDGFVFVDEMGERMRAQYLTCSFPKFLDKHGLRRMRFHDLRHSCASLLLANGVPLKHIQEWLGHSDFTTTANIYAHLDYSSKITSAQAMETGLELPESGNFGSRWEDGESQI